MDIFKIAKNLTRKEDGIYYAKSASDVSYPETGSEHCYQIEDRSFWFKHRNNVIISAVKAFNKEDTFFDVGGGNGFVSRGLQDAGLKVVLIEPSLVGASNAKKRNIENVVCSTLEQAGFESASFDSVGLFDVIEHIQDDYGFLTHIYDFLKIGGHLYVTAPAFNFLWSNEDVYAGHFRRYSLNNINKLLQKCGFEVIYSTYFFSILPLPIFIFRSIPSILGFCKSPNRAKKNKKEHRNNDNMLGKIIQQRWRGEQIKINAKKKIHFGSSCLVVAQKLEH